MKPQITPVRFQELYTQETRSQIGFEQFEEEHENKKPTTDFQDNAQLRKLLLRIKLLNYNNYIQKPVMDADVQTHGNSDGITNYYREITRLGSIESRCRDYLDPATYKNQIYFNTREYGDELELYAPVNSFTIQKIIDDHQDLDAPHLMRPAPSILPIRISHISDDSNSFIIPSDVLNIHAILPRSPLYRLEAIICEINQRSVVYMKHLSTNKWYYYQKDYFCEQLSSQLSDDLNRIIDSRSVSEHQHLIQSAHFLVSMLFYNAVKYVYRQAEKNH